MTNSCALLFSCLKVYGFLYFIFQFQFHKSKARKFRNKRHHFFLLTDFYNLILFLPFKNASCINLHSIHRLNNFLKL